jgi:hypothetical protein
LGGGGYKKEEQDKGNIEEKKWRKGAKYIHRGRNKGRKVAREANFGIS